jgi:hypothetical protein
MTKYYLTANLPNLVLRRCSSSSFSVQIPFLSRSTHSKVETIRFWSVLDSSMHYADGFVILPGVRHELTMTPFHFNSLAIGTIPAYPREIGKA